MGVMRLLIVDDEKTTRESLVRYVPWQTLRIGSVLTAKDGFEALALAGQGPPDILVTDVRMPRMDGLELAERFRELYPRCKILFLSGYADKEYLKRAIHLRAVGYIEKPVDLDEVKRVVGSAVSAREDENASSREQDILRRSYEENIDLIREENLRKLLSGRPTARNDDLSERPITFEPGVLFTVAAITLRWPANVAPEEKDAGRMRIRLICREVGTDRLAARFVGFAETDICALVLARPVTEESAAAGAALSELADRIEMCAEHPPAVAIGIGTPAADSPGLAASFAEALWACRLDFYREHERIFFPSSRRAEKFEASAGMIASFRDAVGRDDSAMAESLVAELTTSVRILEPSEIDSVRDLFFRLFVILFQKTWNSPDPDPLFDEEKHYVWREIQERPNLTSLAALLLEHLSASLDDHPVSSASSRKVLEAQRYLQRNYADMNMSLRALADHVGAGMTYLCSLYRKTTGKTVNEYLTQLRIERAKELLRDVAIKTQEVANRVGYRDATYFSAVFRKQVGLTPTEYRERR
ncbi:MAG TPA: response regulator [Spirochaetia bacterium]|nr:response regulator [Spirochaetia bacterium]